MYSHVILHLLQVPALMITKNEIVKLSKVISELSKVISDRVMRERITLSFVTVFSFPISFFVILQWDLGHISPIEHIPIATGGS